MSSAALKLDQACEGRAAARRRLFRGATIAYGPGLLTVGCVIRDLSETGMRLDLPQGIALPRECWLVEHSAPVAHRVRFAWRRERLAGVEIVEDLCLDPLADPALNILRRIWVEKMPRESVGI